MNSQAITANADSRTGSALMMHRLGSGRSVVLRGEFQPLAHESQLPQSGLSRPSGARVFLGQRRQFSGSAFGSPPSVPRADSFVPQARCALYQLFAVHVFGGFVACECPGAEIAWKEVSHQGSVRLAFPNSPRVSLAAWANRDGAYLQNECSKNAIQGTLA